MHRRIVRISKLVPNFVFESGKVAAIRFADNHGDDGTVVFDPSSEDVVELVFRRRRLSGGCRFLAGRACDGATVWMADGQTWWTCHYDHTAAEFNRFPGDPDDFFLVWAHHVRPAVPNY